MKHIIKNISNQFFQKSVEMSIPLKIMSLDSLDLENVYMSNTDMSIFMKILVTNINL